jgi:hypothetical protein
MVLVSNINSLFTKAVDDLILGSQNDTKLAQSIRWIDTQSQKKGVSFYEMAYVIASKQINKKRAQEWLNNKRDQCNY